VTKILSDIVLSDKELVTDSKSKSFSFELGVCFKKIFVRKSKTTRLNREI